MQQRADDGQGEQHHYEQYQKGGHHKIEGGRHGLAQLLFQFAADDAGNKGRQNAALIAYDGDHSKQIERGNAAGGVSNGVGVGQRTADQHQAQNQAQDWRAAEDPEGRPTYDGGQEREGGAGQHVHKHRESLGHIGRGHTEQA